MAHDLKNKNPVRIWTYHCNATQKQSVLERVFLMLFRLLQADAKDLEEHKIEQEGILKEINKVISAKDSEFQSLSQKIEILTERQVKLVWFQTQVCERSIFLVN